VTGATLRGDNQTVNLTTAPLTYGSNYWVIVNNVRDRATAPNTIASNTTVSFAALPYALQDLGKPSVPSIATIAGNGFDVTTAGADFGGSADQGSFSYQSISGDFDIAARVAGLSLSDAFAKAGLMARENLGFNSRFAAAFTTPTMIGSFFEWRDPAGGARLTSGSFRQLPDTCCACGARQCLYRLRRLRRPSVDPVGQRNHLMPANIFWLCGEQPQREHITTAQFSMTSAMSNAVVGVVINPHEAIGPSSEIPSRVFEIMWKPAPRSIRQNRVR
jgi:hypothetical protein